jgi:hypothetical protein
MILHNNVKLFHDIEDQNEENVQTSTKILNFSHYIYS